MISCTVDSQRSLEARLESHRSQDKSQTHTLIKSIDEHCLSTESFGKSHGEELRSSGLSLQRDTPTHQTPIRKPPGLIRPRSIAVHPILASSLLTEEEDEEKKDNDHQGSDDVDSVVRICQTVYNI
ncbi:Kinesin 5 [Caligus rogercresseyi]|uniref:Kinesin 5 n=1 Tax=Caligus rogercresseyi TaxID=217165 RepID=A0A7T8HEU7_CALRO|nr:Kinesin 5 [Caligus rogercresseyi]